METNSSFVESAEGAKCWYQNNQLHREDGPAVERPDMEEWFLFGLRHRDNGPAIMWKDGSQSWYKHGKIHRLDGPAMIHANGANVWYVDGMCHRTDGPAIEHPAGGGHDSFYLFGKKLPISSVDELPEQIRLHCVSQILES